MEKRKLTEQEETAIRLIHHDFAGLSVDDAAIKMGTTVITVKKLLTSIKRKAPQLFPILTIRQRAIIALYDEHLSRKSIMVSLDISKKVLEKEVTFLRKRGFLFNRGMAQYRSWMDVDVKERF